MTANLTSGAIETIMTGGSVDKPVLQILGQKKIAGSGGQGADRYRLLLSDGKHSLTSAMLATQLNDKITNGELETFTVIRLEKYICNVIQADRRVVILLDITILHPGMSVGERLGNPQSFKPGASSAASSGGNAEPTNPPANQNERANGGAAPLSSRGQNFYGKQQQNTPNKQSFGGDKKPGVLPNTPGGTQMRIHPITSLTPYQNRWTIRARVTSKTGIKTWSNSRGEGKLFSMNLIDDTGEIRATAFKDQVDAYFEMIEIGKVYYIGKATLKTANKQYSSLNNDYEMTFNHETTVQPCEEDVDLPTINFSFVPINELDKHETNSSIDVIGVAKGCSDLNTVMIKSSNREVVKRDVHLVDQNAMQVNLTLWGGDAETFNANTNPIVAIKGCRLSDFNGRSLSAVSSSQLIVNPDIPEAHQLRGWFDNEGRNMDYNQYTRGDGQGGSAQGYSTNWKTFAQMKSEGLGLEKPDYFTAKAHIVYLKKENCMYQACPSAECNKKVIDQGNNTYRCEKCAKEYPSYKWRMILSANVADFSDNTWVTCFQETAENILGRSADEVGRLKTENEAEFDQLFTEANFKSYIFKLRTKMETYNDESRLKSVCVQSNAVDYNTFNKKLIEDIEKMALS